MTTYRYTVAELRGQLRQLLLTGLAVAVGVAFLIASVSGSGALVDSYSQTAAAEVGPGDLQAVPATEGRSVPKPLSDATAARARQVPGVAAASLRLVGQGGVLTPAGRPLDDAAVVSSIAADPALRWQLLKDGRWPGAPGEVLLDADTARRIDARPGSSVRLARADGSTDDAVLVGTLDGRGAPGFAGRPVIGVPADRVDRYATRITGTQLDLRLAPGASRTRTAEALRQALDGQAEVRTRDASVAEATRQSRTVYGVVLIAALSFVLIALAVARMVVSNTFSVVLAQRTRQLALLRCIGADRAQVRRVIRRQGLLLGTGASAAGVLLGTALCAAGTALAGLADLGPVHISLTPAPATCALAALFGVLLTVLAVRGPAKAASAVPPIAALGGAHQAADRPKRLGKAVFSGLLLVFGGAMLAAGALAGPPLSLLAATIGAIASFFGVLRLSHRLLPPIVGVLGVPARRLCGTAGRLATQQLRLNPGRTGATGAALLLGVTVMVSAVTALGITGNSLVPLVSARQPAVFSVAAEEGPVPAGALGALAGERRLRVTPVRSATVEVDGRSTLVVTADPAALNPAAEGVARARGLSDGAALNGLGGDPGEHRVTSAGRPAGVLRFEDGRSGLPFALQSGAVLYVTPTTLDRLAPDAAVTTAWVGPAEGTDRLAARQLMDRALAGYSQVKVTDTTVQAQTLRSLLDRMMLITMALLSFSVAIAGIGVAATLMLGVSERAREIGMLRAIGLSGQQLRRMLTLEALLLSLAGALVGTVLGLGYGWVAARSVTSTAGTVGGPPLLPVAGVLALTVLIGLGAAVLPARRVRRMTIVAAMRTA
ncbi:putative ABC transport system permease protein [Kitasatospora sp. MAA19]|uniref:ABC transporter permease n=1 Tax=unclassified Kitasatospora TaxID=2633591 RepID=UPI00247382EA|nr:ABC transporter permease [Kitasatospora sp. MAA19]MDH6707247.1 putative ABC transport system permease protein [Kitasatospora sp. MAA19]